MLLVKDDQLLSGTDSVSTCEVTYVLKHNWQKWKCVSRLNCAIHILVNKYGFDVNAVEHGKTVLDKICDDKKIILPIVTSLVEAGARPELNGDHDVVAKCFQPEVFGRNAFTFFFDPIVIYVEILLKHGAKPNELQRTESGVKLTSRCLEYLLTAHLYPYRSYREYTQVAELLLVHGACVEPVHMMSALVDLSYVLHLHWTRAFKNDCLRLLSYFRCAGFSSRHARFKRYDPVQLATLRLSLMNSETIKVLRYLRAHIRSLDQRPESLQFQCRRVIRRQMSIAADGKSILDGINDLEISTILRNYLKLQDAE